MHYYGATALNSPGWASMVSRGFSVVPPGLDSSLPDLPRTYAPSTPVRQALG